MADIRKELFFKDPDGVIPGDRPFLMFPIDANEALRRFPDQWSREPWPAPPPPAAAPVPEPAPVGRRGAPPTSDPPAAPAN